MIPIPLSEPFTMFINIRVLRLCMVRTEIIFKVSKGVMYIKTNSTYIHTYKLSDLSMNLSIIFKIISEKLEYWNWKRQFYSFICFCCFSFCFPKNIERQVINLHFSPSKKTQSVKHNHMMIIILFFSKVHNQHRGVVVNFCLLPVLVLCSVKVCSLVLSRSGTSY